MFLRDIFSIGSENKNNISKTEKCGYFVNNDDEENGDFIVVKKNIINNFSLSFAPTYVKVKEIYHTDKKFINSKEDVEKMSVNLSIICVSAFDGVNNFGLTFYTFLKDGSVGEYFISDSENNSWFIAISDLSNINDINYVLNINANPIVKCDKEINTVYRVSEILNRSPIKVIGYNCENKRINISDNNYLINDSFESDYIFSSELLKHESSTLVKYSTLFDECDLIYDKGKVDIKKIVVPFDKLPISYSKIIESFLQVIVEKIANILESILGDITLYVHITDFASIVRIKIRGDIEEDDEIKYVTERINASNSYYRILEEYTSTIKPDIIF